MHFLFVHFIQVRRHRRTYISMVIGPLTSSIITPSRPFVDITNRITVNGTPRFRETLIASRTSGNLECSISDLTYGLAYQLHLHPGTLNLTRRKKFHIFL